MGSPFIARFNFILVFLLITAIKSSAANTVIFAEITQLEVIAYTNTILVSWDDVRGAEKYHVRYSKQNDMSNSVLLETTSVRLELQDLASETQYYIKVRALNKSQWSSWSEIKDCETASFTTTVGTYNILSSKYDDIFPNHTWDSRKKAMESIIIDPDNNPDIFGIQEGMVEDQVNELADMLKKSYTVHISKRDVSARAIFWKSEKYELLEFNDDIEVFNKEVKDYDTARYISHVRLRRKDTGHELMVFNLHAPSNYSKDNSKLRNIMVKNIIDKAKELSKKAHNTPVILIGDFNSSPNSADNETPSAPTVAENSGFSDTFKATDNQINAYYGTHDRITSGVTTSGAKKDNCSKRIDYIFTFPKDKVTVSDYRIIVNLENGSGNVLAKPIPSDHRPVKSTLHIHY